jgi:hypothetical protein
MSNQNILSSGFNELYNYIYCDIFPSNNGFNTCNNCNYGEQTVLKTIQSKSDQECLNDCNNDKKCTSYSYNTQNNNCTEYVSFPTQINNNVENVNSGYSIHKFGYNYNNLTSSQKQNIQQKCANQFLNNTFTPNNKNIDLTSCLSISNSEPSGTIGILGKSPQNGLNTFLNLDAECVYNTYNNNGIQTSVKNNAVYNDNDSLINGESDPIINNAENLYNNYNNLKEKVVNKSEELSKYDNSYKNYNNTVNNNNNQLLQNYTDTVERNKNIVDNVSKILLKPFKINENFENTYETKNNNKFLFIILILFILFFILYIFKKK